MWILIDVRPALLHGFPWSLSHLCETSLLFEFQIQNLIYQHVGAKWSKRGDQGSRQGAVVPFGSDRMRVPSAEGNSHTKICLMSVTNDETCHMSSVVGNVCSICSVVVGGRCDDG